MSAFARHCQVVPLRGIIAPRPVTVFPVRVNPALLGSKAQRDAHLDRLIAEERQHNLDVEAEVQAEGRVYPVRPSPHDD
jgi:hypothetical protein